METAYDTDGIYLGRLADVFGDPTRRGIYRHLRERDAPQSASEVADVFGLHRTVARAHLEKLLDLGLVDAFRLFDQPDKSYSWWDYREFAFRRNRGLRIDYILVSELLKPLVAGCVIDKLPRKNERPSDHVPVVVELG